MPDTPELRIQIAAYLAGDLDDDAARELEARMESEPWLARLADEQADLLVRLGGVDDVTPPDGFGERLRAGLAAEIGHDLPEVPDSRALRASGAAAFDGWATPAGRRDATRPGRTRAEQRRLRRRATTFLGVAAAVAVLFVASTSVLLNGSSEDSGDSAEESAVRTGEDAADFAESVDELAAEDSAEESDGDEGAANSALSALQDDAVGAPPAGALADAPVQDDAADAADGSAAGSAASQDASVAAVPEAAAPTDRPAILSLGEIGVGDDAVRQQIAADPAAEGLLGRPANQASELAASFGEQIRSAPAFPDGTAPAQCLDQVLEGAPVDSVPGVAAQFTADGQARLGYALVRSTDGQVLDRVDVWVVEAAGCVVVTVVS